MENRRITAHPYTRPGVLYALWLVLFFMLFFRSWVSEDAYITFRVIDNFVNGYGLRWNVHERVQAYTHPLWLLLHLPFAVVWKNLFHLNMALSLICSMAAVALVLATFRHTLAVMVALFMLPLLLSKCFLDYASSGLETPLSYLLFAALGFVLVRLREHRHFLLALSFTTSLLLLNRLDHLIMVAPLFAVLAWRNPERIFSARGLAVLTLGMLPLLSWFAFSLFYYGFIMPNTKYAKLDTGLPFSDYLAQGAQYAFTWLTHDTLSVVVVIAAIVMAMRSSAMHKALAVGIALNIAYVISIGGDYMMGRFFAFIFFVAAWLLLASAPLRIKPDLLFTAVLAFLCAHITSSFVVEIRAACIDCLPVRGRVIDAQKVFGGNRLFSQYWPPHMRSEGQYKFAKAGKEFAAQEPPPAQALRYIGMAGYLAGPRAIFVDDLGLADPLLSRLPARTDTPFYVGHYRRHIPRGYMEAVQNGDTSKMHPALAQYYDKIRLITQGPLLDKERLITIIRFNLREYDQFRYHYTRKKKK